MHRHAAMAAMASTSARSAAVVAAAAAPASSRYGAQWFDPAAMAAGGLVCAPGCALPVPVVVPLSLVPGGVGGGANGMMYYARLPQSRSAPRGVAPNGAPVGGTYGQRWGGSQRSRMRARGRRVDVVNGSKRTVYVKEVHVSVTESELAELFERACGRVLDCRLCGDAGSEMFRYAFVALESDEAVRKALAMHGDIVHGHAITVLKSETPVIPVNPLLLPQTQEEIESCARTIYVANVDKSVREKDLQKLCEDFAGAVSRLHVQTKQYAAANVAFVEFVEAKSAGAALRLTGRRLGNRSIRVNPSKTPLRTMRKSAHAASEHHRHQQRGSGGVETSASARATSESETTRATTNVDDDDDDDDDDDNDAPTAAAAPVDDDTPVKKVYVTNIPKNMSPGSLRALFSECGSVAHIELLNHPKSKFPFAFIDFDDVESTNRALAMHGKTVENSPLTVELTKNTRQRRRAPMSPEQREKAERTIYVTDIDPELDPTYIRERFDEACGKVSLFWHKIFDKGVYQAIAYVEFVEQSSVDKALGFCRTHFLSDARLVKIRHSLTALRARDDADGECYTPELDTSSPSSVVDDDARSKVTDQSAKESVVRDLSRMDEMSSPAAA